MAWTTKIPKESLLRVQLRKRWAFEQRTRSSRASSPHLVEKHEARDISKRTIYVCLVVRLHCCCAAFRCLDSVKWEGEDVLAPSTELYVDVEDGGWGNCAGGIINYVVSSVPELQYDNVYPCLEGWRLFNLQKDRECIRAVAPDRCARSHCCCGLETQLYARDAAFQRLACRVSKALNDWPRAAVVRRGYSLSPQGGGLMTAKKEDLSFPHDPRNLILLALRSAAL